jgi:hypothetical protein
VSPKYNPKHDKRRNLHNQSRQSKKYLRNRKLITVIIIVCVIGVSIVGIFLGKFGYEEWAVDHVQKGDIVTVQLRIWIADDDGNNVSMVVWNQTDDPLVVKIKDSALETEIPYGLWDQLIGMKVNETEERLWLPRCVDDMIPIPDVEFHPDAVAGDGWDDRFRPGSLRSRCYSYGYDTTEELDGLNLRFTPIIYWIHVVNIVKDS